MGGRLRCGGAIIMNSPIKPGDLVMAVRGMPCCGAMGNFNYGNMRHIVETRVAPAGAVCGRCGASMARIPMARLDADAAPISMLKKIDPPAVGDTLPTRADIEVPTCS